MDFLVEGSGLFPFDMLRYDHCWPKSESDSAIIESSTRRGAGSRYRRVRLSTANSRLAPSVARWESFGWRVVP